MICIMNEEEGEIFLDRADKIVKSLTIALAKEIDKLNDDDFTSDLLMFVLAKFSAGTLLSIQELTKQLDIEDNFGVIVKELMAVMGKNETIQSIKIGRRELERKPEESEKIIAEKKHKTKALKEEQMAN